MNAQVELKEIYEQATSIRKGLTDRIAAIKENPFLFALLTKDDHLRKDSQLLKELIKKDPQMIVMLSPVQQQDPQFGLLALQQDPSTIQYLTPNDEKSAPQNENNSGIPSPDSDPRRRSQ